MKTKRLVLAAAAVLLAACNSGSSGGAYAHGGYGYAVCGKGSVYAYYTPVETDYPREPSIVVAVPGGSLLLRKEFAEEVARQGAGRLETGMAVGYWDRDFHVTPTPLGAAGRALTAGTLSVDTDTIPQGALVSIDFSGRLQYFWAEDVRIRPDGRGSFDVALYTGEGAAALTEAERINRQATAPMDICFYRNPKDERGRETAHAAVFPPPPKPKQPLPLAKPNLSLPLRAK